MDHFMLVHNFNEDLKINALKNVFANYIQNFIQKLSFYSRPLCCHKPKLKQTRCAYFIWKSLQRVIKVHTLCTFIVGYRGS